MDNPGKMHPAHVLAVTLWIGAAMAFATAGATLVALAVRGRSLPRPDIIVLGLTTLAGALLLSVLSPSPAGGPESRTAGFIWVTLLVSAAGLAVFGIPWYFHWLLHFGRGR